MLRVSLDYAMQRVISIKLVRQATALQEKVVVSLVSADAAEFRVAMRSTCGSVGKVCVMVFSDGYGDAMYPLPRPQPWHSQQHLETIV